MCGQAGSWKKNTFIIWHKIEPCAAVPSRESECHWGCIGIAALTLTNLGQLFSSKSVLSYHLVHSNVCERQQCDTCLTNFDQCVACACWNLFFSESWRWWFLFQVGWLPCRTRAVQCDDVLARVIYQFDSIDFLKSGLEHIFALIIWYNVFCSWWEVGWTL